MDKFVVTSDPDYNEAKNTLLSTMPDTPVELIDIILEDIIEWTIQGWQMNITDLDLHFLSNFKNIYDLDISFSPLADLSPLVGMNIQILEINYCENITDLSPLSDMRSLKELHISGCPRITDLSPLKSTNLTTLFMNKCPRITDLSPLASINTLEELVINDNRQITELSPLEHIDSLKHLYMYHCNPHLDTTLERKGVKIYR